MKKFTFKGVLDGFRSSVQAAPRGTEQEIQETLRSEHFQVKKVSRSSAQHCEDGAGSRRWSGKFHQTISLSCHYSGRRLTLRLIPIQLTEFLPGSIFIGLALKTFGAFEVVRQRNTWIICVAVGVQSFYR
ncbi:unnamed protein product [Colias eurytheme]|nr:unnamed protein product [Colias eurytheme]